MHFVVSVLSESLYFILLCSVIDIVADACGIFFAIEQLND